MKGKIIIISAPSGCGKSTIINALLERGEIDMQFSISATNRPPREGEQLGLIITFLLTMNSATIFHRMLLWNMRKYIRAGFTALSKARFHVSLTKVTM